MKTFITIMAVSLILFAGCQKDELAPVSSQETTSSQKEVPFKESPQTAPNEATPGQIIQYRLTEKEIQEQLEAGGIATPILPAVVVSGFPTNRPNLKVWGNSCKDCWIKNVEFGTEQGQWSFYQ